jgi:predicted metal-binding protein
VNLMSQIERDLEGLCKLAKELGATNAASFNANDVVVDERVRLKCMIPPCDDYGLNLMCPPYVMSVQEFREVLSKYEWAILIQIEAPITAKMKEQIRQAEDVAALYNSTSFMDIYNKTFDPIKLRLHHIVSKVEAQAAMLGYRFATGFNAGSCKLCPECTVKNSQEPCRHPYQSRPSMEAVGIDVFKTAENAGLPFDMPTKDKAVWNGLVLVD